MTCSELEWLILAVGLLAPPMFGQQSAVPEPADLRVELRSATGSNRFRIGEVVPIETFCPATRHTATWSPANCSASAASATLNATPHVSLLLGDVGGRNRLTTEKVSENERPDVEVLIRKSHFSQDRREVGHPWLSLTPQ